MQPADPVISPLLIVYIGIVIAVIGFICVCFSCYTYRDYWKNKRPQTQTNAAAGAFAISGLVLFFLGVALVLGTVNVST